MIAEPFTRDEWDEINYLRKRGAFGLTTRDFARLLATVDARDAEIARLAKRVEEAEKVIECCAADLSVARDVAIDMCAQFESEGDEEDAEEWEDYADRFDEAGHKALAFLRPAAKPEANTPDCAKGGSS